MKCGRPRSKPAFVQAESPCRTAQDTQPRPKKCTITCWKQREKMAHPTGDSPLGYDDSPPPYVNGWSKAIPGPGTLTTLKRALAGARGLSAALAKPKKPKVKGTQDPDYVPKTGLANLQVAKSPITRSRGRPRVDKRRAPKRKDLEPVQQPEASPKESTPVSTPTRRRRRKGSRLAGWAKPKPAQDKSTNK